MDDAIRDGFAPVHVESYLSKGRLRYALIVEKGAPGSFLAKHGLTLDQHRQWLDTAKARGLKPVNVSVVSVNNKRSYTVLYRSDSIGAWEVHSRVPIDKYQAVFDKQDRAGKRPSYLAAYMHGGKPHISAVFASSYKTAVTRHGLSPKAYQSEWASNTKADRLTRVVSAHDGAKRKHLFVGVWKSGAP